ncbi:PucR family transcriptional regulator [Flexivirga endophytica]|uniref:PucR family transcriptional regulator n=1 Tax=Flexivirga endophytica TaxID=1849103 RepID=UPI0016669A63|nr:helix-turn-helix domain-containing protein [Flexivirga endophytica]
MVIEHELAALAAAVQQRIPDLVAQIEREVIEQVPEFHSRDDPVLLESERPSIDAALTSIVDGLASGRRVPEGASDAALREARAVAQSGIELQVLLRTYRLGQAITWNAILEEALALVPEEHRLTVLRQASDYHYAWNDAVMEGVVAAYQAEHKAYFFRSQDRKRRAIVNDLLRGVPTETEELGYNLRVAHLGLVAWGSSPEANIRAIAATLKSRVLTVSGTSGTVLGWLDASALRNAQEAEPEVFTTLPSTHVAVGEIASGIEGFRRSHRQAWQAYRVGRFRPRAVVRYPDVALEALVLKDRQMMRDFVARELRGLDEPEARTELLRETLKAYFASGQNAASTAAAIHVHERTVAYRLRSIEQRLEVSITSRRDEIAVALRLADLLAAIGAKERAENQPHALDLSDDAL